MRWTSPHGGRRSHRAGAGVDKTDTCHRCKPKTAPALLTVHSPADINTLLNDFSRRGFFLKTKTMDLVALVAGESCGR